MTFGNSPVGKYNGKPPEAVFFDIWAFPYRGIPRETAGGGELLISGNLPIGKYKGKPPEDGLFDIWVFAYSRIQREAAGSFFFYVLNPVLGQPAASSSMFWI